MSDYRSRERGNSIFSDDDRDSDRWRGERGERGDQWRSSGGWQGNDRSWDSARDSGRSWNRDQDDRGFFDRASDEVRSWFGDEEAERRRERDAREQDHSQWRSNAPYGGDRQSSAYGRSQDRDDRSGYRAGSDKAGRFGGSERYSRTRYPATSGSDYDNGGFASGGFGDGGFGGSRSYGSGRAGQDRFTNHHDEAYRSWRDQQIASLDREYDEYRKHRQTQFEQDFTNFRQNRQSITSGGTTLTQANAHEPQSVSTHSAAGESPSRDATELSTGAEMATADSGRSTRNR